MTSEEKIRAATEHFRKSAKIPIPRAAYYEMYNDSVAFFDQRGGLIMMMSKSNFEALSKEKE